VLAGGTFLVACDTVGRTAVAPVEIPVGIITALIGGPFFLAMLVQGHTRRRLRGET
jgi:iron complex transport system permease protein